MFFFVQTLVLSTRPQMQHNNSNSELNVLYFSGRYESSYTTLIIDTQSRQLYTLYVHRQFRFGSVPLPYLSSV